MTRRLDFESIFSLSLSFSIRLTILLADSHRSYNDRTTEQWLFTAGSWNAKKHRAYAAITRKCLVFYIFALERAVESDNRVLENQLLVTVRGRTTGPIFFLPLRLRHSFVHSLLEFPSKTVLLFVK